MGEAVRDPLVLEKGENKKAPVGGDGRLLLFMTRIRVSDVREA